MAKCSNPITKMLGIRWTIPNVSKIEQDSMIIGPDFYFTPECMIRLSFKRRPNIWVYLCNKSDTKIAIERRIILFDYYNKTIHEEKDSKIFSLEKDKDVDVIGWVEEKIINNLFCDVLIIDLCVTTKEVATKNLNLLICDPDHEKKLREDLKTMLENPVNSDVSVQAGDEWIPAHWSILCARSPYFKRMLDSGMQESVQNSVTITDSSPGTVKRLIQFLYTADFIQTDDIQELFDLYYAADKYQVMDLRTLCGRKIVSNATTDNVCEILQFASRHSDKPLKMEAINFIRSYSNVVFQTEGWKKFEESEPETAELISFCLKQN